jgi:ribosomal protein S2
MKKRELEKLENIYKWVKNLTKLPDLVIVVDAEYNLWVIDELEKVNIPYIAIANTNLSRWLLTDKLIVANTNSYESVIYILNYLLK